MRIVIVIKRLDKQYQAQLRQSAGGNLLFFSRRSSSASNAKRDAETLFGPLAWELPPAALKASEPEVSSVAYWNA